MESINLTTTFNQEVNRYKDTFCGYDIKDEKKTLSKSEKKEKECDGYICMYECGKHLLYSMYESAYASQEMNINQIKKMVKSFNYGIKEKVAQTKTCKLILIVVRSKV